MSTSIDPATGKPKKPGLINVYTMLLLVSLLAISFGCLLLLVEFGRYGYQMKPDPNLLRITTPSAPPAADVPAEPAPPAMNNEAPPQNPAPPADGTVPPPPATTPDPNNI